jgi:hypothetical protein
MSHWTIRVRITEEDMETGKLRGKTETYLVQAETIEAAQALIREFFRGLTLDHEVRSISKSGITEYITTESLSK